MRLTKAMADPPYHYPLVPTFSVTETTVTLEKINLPYWNDAFAACIYLNLHHRGPKAFREGYRAMQGAMGQKSILADSELYNALESLLGQGEHCSLINKNRGKPACDFVVEIASLARFKEDMPMTFSELKRDLSGNRRSLL